MHDIIPDIHGQAEKLSELLARLGWRRSPSGWTNDEPGREIVFLGDFIDRGPDNAGVLRIVRGLVDAGKARALMGNHELNAIHFHTPHPDTGDPLRKHSEKNLGQHASFLAEFPLGAAATRDALDWMRTLPLFLETEDFRAVHACWEDETIARLRELTSDGVLTRAQIEAAAIKGHDLHGLVETTTKGPETKLPDGYAITDKNGQVRTEIRLQWWNATASTWRDVAISVPDVSALPEGSPGDKVLGRTYPPTAKPVFFGHYWLDLPLRLQAPNALCLDYSAGTDGPLVAYRWEGAAHAIDLGNVHGLHGGASRPGGANA